MVRVTIWPAASWAGIPRASSTNRSEATQTVLSPSFSLSSQRPYSIWMLLPSWYSSLAPSTDTVSVSEESAALGAVACPTVLVRRI